MAEKQEKVWVVSRGREYEDGLGLLSPVKAFDDRKDARAYVKDRQKRSRRYKYFMDGVKKG